MGCWRAEPSRIFPTHPTPYSFPPSPMARCTSPTDRSMPRCKFRPASPSGPTTTKKLNRPKTTSGSKRSTGRPTKNCEICARRARTNTSAASRRMRQSNPPLPKQPGRRSPCFLPRSISTEQIDLGVGEDQAPCQQSGKIAHDLHRDLRMEAAIIGKAVERQFETLHRRVGPDVGAAMLFDYRHLAEFHAGTKRCQPYPARQFDAHHSA